MPDAEYMRAYRKARPRYRKADAARKAARWRALERLARAHPAEFMRFYSGELRAVERARAEAAAAEAETGRLITETVAVLATAMLGPREAS